MQPVLLQRAVENARLQHRETTLPTVVHVKAQREVLPEPQGQRVRPDLHVLTRLHHEARQDKEPELPHSEVQHEVGVPHLKEGLTHLVEAAKTVQLLQAGLEASHQVEAPLDLVEVLHLQDQDLLARHVAQVPEVLAPRQDHQVEVQAEVQVEEDKYENSFMLSPAPPIPICSFGAE